MRFDEVTNKTTLLDTRNAETRKNLEETRLEAVFPFGNLLDNEHKIKEVRLTKLADLSHEQLMLVIGNALDKGYEATFYEVENDKVPVRLCLYALRDELIRRVEAGDKLYVLEEGIKNCTYVPGRDSVMAMMDKPHLSDVINGLFVLAYRM